MDADGIRAEVERRQRRALELGIIPVVLQLYHESIVRYADWAKVEHMRELVLPEVTPGDSPDRGNVRIVYNAKQYSFRYKDKMFFAGDHYAQSYDFLINLDNDTVLESHGLCESALDEYGVLQDSHPLKSYIRAGYSWYDVSLGGIKAFIEGDWVNEIKVLWERIQSHEKRVHELRKVRQQNDPQMLEDLKKRFGIS